MASRQNLTGRGNAYKGYGALAAAYRGAGSTGENPMMTKYKAEQKSSKGINRNDMTKKRIAQAQQTGADRGTQKQIVRHTTPGGGGYDRAAAIRREKELSGMSESDQMLHLGRKANPNAGNPNKPPPGGGVRMELPPEQQASLNKGFQTAKDRGGPFGPRWTPEGEGGKWSAEQKQGWARGESPRQQAARVTGGQFGAGSGQGPDGAELWRRDDERCGSGCRHGRRDPGQSPKGGNRDRWRKSRHGREHWRRRKRADRSGCRKASQDRWPVIHAATASQPGDP